MKPMLKVSAAVLFAAISALPALAAINTAVVVQGNSTAAAPASSIDDFIGKWTMQDLNALGSAHQVTVFDTKNVYDAADLSKLSDADTRAIGDLKKMHDQIDADAGLRAWFAKNSIDINRVIAITDNGGAVDVYLY
ncbi:MAG TPA: hypothetical protein VG757_03540 [Devosia sp.]|nr:hypothetical protein [Devosia sp.]